MRALAHKMKIRITINGKHLSTPEVIGRGFLGAHINLDDKQGTDEPEVKIHFNGYDTNDSEETKYLKWEGATLKEGDLVQIEIMPNVEADEPTEIKSSLKDKSIFGIEQNQAEEILEIAYGCNRQLQEMLTNLREELKPEEYRKVAYGVGRVINEVFSSLAEPIYRKHPSKVPEALKDQPL